MVYNCSRLAKKWRQESLKFNRLLISNLRVKIRNFFWVGTALANGHLIKCFACDPNRSFLVQRNTSKERNNMFHIAQRFIHTLPDPGATVLLMGAGLAFLAGAKKKFHS